MRELGEIGKYRIELFLADIREANGITREEAIGKFCMKSGISQRMVAEYFKILEIGGAISKLKDGKYYV